MPTGACGINCDVCRLNFLAVCSTCGPGKSQEARRKIAAQERILGGPCPILACALSQQVDFCLRDCGRFPCDYFRTGPYPFSQAYLRMQERRRKEGPKGKIPCGDSIKVPIQYWTDLVQRDVTLLCRNALVKFYAPDKIILPFLGQDFLVDRQARAVYCHDSDGWEVIEDPVLETLCLVYLLNVSTEPLSHAMVSPHDLRDAQFFKGPHELRVRPLVQRYGSDLDGFRRSVEHLGGESLELADVSYKVTVFPKVPIYYLLWKGDEEFGARLSILFDRSIECHLSADAIWGLTNLVSDILLIGDKWRPGGRPRSFSTLGRGFVGGEGKGEPV